MANSFVQTILDTEVDATTLTDFVTKPSGDMVSRRLAPPIEPLEYHVDRLTNIGDGFTQTLTVASDAANQAVENANGLIDNVTNQASQSVQNAIRDVAIDANLVTDALTTVVPITTSAAARTQLEKNRESVSVYDFFTDTELASYSSNKATFDATRPLQEFFNYIRDNNVGTAYCFGALNISQGLVVGNGTSLTKSVVGDITLKALNPIDTMFSIACGQDFKWFGEIKTIGTGSGADYSSRTCRVGILVGGSQLGSRAHFDSLNAQTFSEVGVLFGNLSTLSSCKSIRTNGCGSGVSSAGYSLLANFTARVDSGGSGSTSQRTTLNVDTLPPDNLSTGCFIFVGDEIHEVVSIDRAASTLTVYPWVDTSLTTGSIRYIYGAGVYTRGGDAGLLTLGKIDVINSGIALWEAALYAGNIRNLTSQFNGIGYVIAGYSSSAHIGGELSSIYLENNDVDILRTTRATLSKSILSNYALNLDKIKASYYPRTSANTLVDTGALDGIALNYNGHISGFERHNAIIDITSVDRGVRTVYANTIGFSLQVSKTINRLLGFKSMLLNVHGVGVNKAPSGTLTFTAPTGFTVNGGASVAYSGLTKPPMFNAIYDGSTDIKLVVLNDPFTAKGTTAQRPVSPTLGQSYYDTTLLASGKPISWNGTAWVDALGATV